MKVLTDRTAADLVRLLRERPALPSRRVRMAHGAPSVRVRPFAVRAVADGWEVYLPPDMAEAVRFRGAVVAPGVDLGTAAAPWMPCEFTGTLYLIIEFAPVHDDSDPPAVVDYEAVEWTLSATLPSSPDEDGHILYPHLVAAVEDNLGLVQYHLGSFALGDPAAAPQEAPDPVPEPDPCEEADDEAFPSRIDETATGPSGSGDQDGGGGINEGDGDQFPSKVDVCW